MKIKVVISLILLCCSFGLFAKAQNANTFEAETKVRLEYIEKQADKNEAKLNDEIKELNEKLTQQSKQIQQEKNELNDKMAKLKASDRVVSWGGWIIGLLSIIIGVGGVVAPILMYRRNEKLRTDVKREKENWENERTELTQEHKSSIEKLKLEIQNLQNSFTQKMSEFEIEFKGFLSDASKRILSEENVINLNENDRNLDEHEAKQIKEDILKLIEKAQMNNSFETFYKSAHLLYYLKNYNLALNNINKAIELQKNDMDLAKFLTIKASCLYFLNQKENSLETQNQIIKLYRPDNKFIQEQVAMAYFNKGVTQYEIGKPEEAIVTYQEMANLFKNSEENNIQEKVATTLVNKAVTLGKIGKEKDEINGYQEVIDLYRDTKNSKVQEQVAIAYFNRGAKYGEIGEEQNEIDAYDEMIKLFKDSNVSLIQEKVAFALFNKGVRLMHMSKHKESLDTYDKMIQMFKTNEKIVIQEKVVSAYINKGVLFGRIGNSQESINTYDETIKLYKNVEDETIQEQVASAYFNKAVRLDKIGKFIEAIGTCNTMIDNFESYQVPSIIALVDKCKEFKKYLECRSSGGA